MQLKASKAKKRIYSRTVADEVCRTFIAQELSVEVDVDYAEKINQVKEYYKELEEPRFLGIRFDRRNLAEGDLLGVSKGNPDRLDSREFPDFESEEYSDLPDLSGTSSYDIDYWENYIDLEDLKDQGFHLYVIGGDNYEEGEDRDEMVIYDAEVLSVIF